MVTGLLSGLVIGLVIAAIVWWRTAQPIQRLVAEFTRRRDARILARGFVRLSDVQPEVLRAMNASIIMGLNLAADLTKIEDAPISARQNGNVTEVGFQKRYGFEVIYVVDVPKNQIRDINGVEVAAYFDNGQWERTAPQVKRIRKVSAKTAAPKNNGKLVQTPVGTMTRKEYLEAKANGHLS